MTLRYTRRPSNFSITQRLWSVLLSAPSLSMFSQVSGLLLPLGLLDWLFHTVDSLMRDHSSFKIFFSSLETFPSIFSCKWIDVSSLFKQQQHWQGYNVEASFERQEYFSQFQDTTDPLPCHIHLPGCLWIMDPHSSAPKKNTSHGNEVLPQDTTHLIQRPCYQRGSLCQDPAGNGTTRRPPDDCKETQTAVVWSCLPFIRSGQNRLARHHDSGKKTRQSEEEVGRQQQGMDRPGVHQVPEGSGEQGKMEETGCKIICDAPTTLGVKG